VPAQTPFDGRPFGQPQHFQVREENPGSAGMGATLTAVWIDGEKLSVAHVGDSRAYLLRSATCSAYPGSFFVARAGSARHPDRC